MGVQKKSYSQFAILDIVCMTIGFFLGIFIRHGDFQVLKVYTIYKEVFILLILAILLHAVLDGVAVLAAKSGMSLVVVEAFVWLIAIGIALIARNVWKKETK